ncbi:4,5-DOPA dioxygenase extradiol [Maritalea porphyrae]|mgnify:CR=1 FL=1|jgi:4,5-DOPA dioxygenase extradiol|uniref:4,5-DOPA-extradiol-dioxygenase n=1 Tax=Maritalea porphyrae TaxID=880732 RepID=UPI0022AFC025|nr:4,5-DOPA dioxygenase extradiol [Maritalea porphyrae]MCZ4273667.1 4,5-DOPA dioxygenase extradiol [Maritalea porphyrae]
MPAVIDFQALLDQLKPSPKMPALFLGHGSPMYAITSNEFSKSWQQLGEKLPTPQAILCVSAHWETRGTTLVQVSERPKTIHDFYGFPQELFDVQYPAVGAPDAAREVAALLQDHNGHETMEWGLDHGAWAVLRHLFPAADVPVFQLSIDMSMSLADQYDLAAQLRSLREKGVMIIGSGNVVHNLHVARADDEQRDFALEFDHYVGNYLRDGDHAGLTGLQSKQTLFAKAHPTFEHFSPAIYVAAVAHEGDQLAFFNEHVNMGSISMRSFVYF